MKQFSVLFRAELTRMKTPVNIALPFFFLVLTGLITVLSTRNSAIISFPSFLQNTASGFLLTFGPAILGGGMLALDVKEHWARTTLLRPVTRELYLLVRVSTIFAGFLICYLIAGVIPVIFTSAVFDKTIVGTVAESVGVFLLMSLQGLLIIILMSLLSCWLPGITNLVVLALWATASQLAGSYITFQYWDNAFLTIAKEFFFPSGFLDAGEELLSGGKGVLSGLLWGIAGLSGYAAFTIWSFNRMNVESGSE